MKQLTPESLPERISQGLERLCTTLRSDRWNLAALTGLNPTQHAILEAVARRAATPLRIRDVAAHLALAGPTVTDSVNALERKNMIRREPHPDDSRAVVLKVTPAGAVALETVAGSPGDMGRAVAQMPEEVQADLLFAIVRLIRSLQIAEAIPTQRLCVSCRFFRPYAHPGSATPHHCEFVNAAIGPAQLQVDCGDHEAAEDADQTAIWLRMEEGTAANP